MPPLATCTPWAHQLGGFYDLPHGVCNAILLPHVESFNASICPARLTDVAKAMGLDTQHLDHEQGAAAAIAGIRKLSLDVGIPGGLTELGVSRRRTSRHWRPMP